MTFDRALGAIYSLVRDNRFMYIWYIEHCKRPQSLDDVYYNGWDHMLHWQHILNIKQ
jgi:hypothetical protein